MEKGTETEVLIPSFGGERRLFHGKQEGRCLEEVSHLQLRQQGEPETKFPKSGSWPGPRAG